MGPIHQVTLPKWGLSMKDARVIAWLKEVGAPVAVGDELVEIESEKIAGAVEASGCGVLRRQLVRSDEVAAVGSLLGIVADAEVPDAEIDAVVSEHLANASTATATAAALDPAPQKIAVGSRALRYLVRGEGDEAAILIHGFGGDLNAWLFNHSALADRRRVYALDLPGHGESTKDVGTGTIDELAQSVAAFMNAMGIASAHVAGHSLGGAIALALATREPTRIRSLALLASAGLGPEVDASYVEGFVAAANRNALKPHAAKLFADPSLVTRRMIDDLLKYKRLEGVEACLRLITEKFLAGGQQAVILRDDLSRLRQPALVVWGGDDQIIPASHAAGLPSSVNAEVIAGKGHMIMLEAPGEVNRLLNAFWG
jgi:pyruvate dehydrogenase E2 component (dihydrolipoamide acetyltransferase)